MEPTILQSRSFAFAAQILDAMEDLRILRKEFIISNQLARSGTSIGAMIHEAKFAESRADFRHKFNVALKEANESVYWLRLLQTRSYAGELDLDPLLREAKELTNILAASVRTLKKEVSNDELSKS